MLELEIWEQELEIWQLELEIWGLGLEIWELGWRQVWKLESGSSRTALGSGPSKRPGWGSWRAELGTLPVQAWLQVWVSWPYPACSLGSARRACRR